MQPGGGRRGRKRSGAGPPKEIVNSMPNPLSAIQDLATTAGAFFFVLAIVVFVHEFGHFQVARWCKVAIEAFSIGFGARLAGWTDKQGVEWRIGALPIGGFVKFVDDA